MAILAVGGYATKEAYDSTRRCDIGIATCRSSDKTTTRSNGYLTPGFCVLPFKLPPPSLVFFSCACICWKVIDPLGIGRILLCRFIGIYDSICSDAGIVRIERLFY